MNVLSISSKTAPVEVRRRLSFDESEKTAFIKEALDCKIMSQCVLVSTCNRCEVYFEGDIRKTERFLASFKGAEEEKLKKYYNIYTAENAVSHLLKVACGMDSVILGEDEILGQIKDAFFLSQKAGATAFEFNTVFKLAVTAAKKIKTNTLLSKTPVSYGTLAANIVFSLPKAEKTVLIIGISGKIGSISAKNILSKPNIRVIGTIRRHNGEGIITSDKRVTTVPFDERYKYINEADVIISATSSPHYTITKDELLKYTSGKRIFIDLAVVPDIDEEVGTLEGCTLYTIDYFKTLAEKNNNIKLREAANINELIEAEKDEIIKELLFRKIIDVCPDVKRLADEKGIERMFYFLRKNGSRAQNEAVLEWLCQYIKSEGK